MRDDERTNARFRPARCACPLAAGSGPDRGCHGRPRHRGSGGDHDLGGPCHAGAALARPGRDGVGHHTVHAAVSPPRRGGQADAGRNAAEPGRVVDDVAQRAHLRVRAAARGEVSQRRPGHGGGCSVLLRALQGRRRSTAEKQGQGSADPGPAASPLRAERGLARLHDVLRHHRYRRRLGRAQEVRREGWRRRLPEGSDRGWSLSVRERHAWCRGRAGGVRGLLAQGPQCQAPGLEERARRDDAGGRPQAGRGRHRLFPQRPHRRGRPAYARAQALGGAHQFRLLHGLRGPVGFRLAVA